MDARKDLKQQTVAVQDEPQVVAEFRIIPTHDRNAQIIEEYSTCCLCGSDLEFTHLTNFVQYQVTEEATCPSCHIRQKKEMHSLH